MEIEKKTINARVDVDQLQDVDWLQDVDQLQDVDWLQDVDQLQDVDWLQDVDRLQDVDWLQLRDMDRLRLRDMDRLRLQDMDRLRSWVRNQIMDRFWVKNIMDQVRFMEIMNRAQIMDRVLDLFRDMVQDLGMDGVLDLGMDRVLDLGLDRVLWELNVSLKEADAKPAEVCYSNNSEMLRGDGLQTQSCTPVDECGLRSIYGDSLEFISVEMLRMANMSPFSAMKLMVMFGSQEVVGLIDSGATRSFISPSLAAVLNLPCDNSVRRDVQLGNGMCYTQEGICRKVDFQVQGIPFTDDFLPFELGDVDVILGYTWLKTLGPVLTDWNNLTMEFKHGDSSVCLSGDPSLSCHPADLHAILAWEYLSVLVLGSISVLFQSVYMQ